MAYTFPWDESFPPGTQSADQINEDLQRILVQTRERLADILGVVFPNDTVTTATASKLVLKGLATSKIIPGATSFSIRNAADSADNFIVTDVANATVRGQLTASNGFVSTTGNFSGDIIRTGAAGTNRVLNFQSAGTDRWHLGVTNTAESGGNVGSDFVINRYDDTGTIIATALSIIRSSGSVTVGNAFTVASGGITVVDGNIVISSGTTTRLVQIDSASGQKRAVRYTTGGSLRWEAQVTNTAESGANAGSDYALSAYDDAGVFITNALQIIRSNRAATFGGDITITHGGGPSFLNLSNAAGQDRRVRFQTSGSDRFTIGIGSGLESGANAGSDIIFRCMDDAGATIADFLTVVRATGISTFNKQVIITNNSAPTFEIKKDASVDNRYIRLTDTEATGQQWDLIQRSVAAGSHFLIFNVTGNIIAVQITPVGTVTIGQQSTGSIGLIVDRNVAAGNNGIIQLSRQGSTKGFIGLDGSDNFVIFNSGGTGILTVSTATTNAIIFDATTGFRIGGAAGGGKYLRGDGTNFVSSSLLAGDLPTALTPTTLTIGGGQTISRILSASVAWNPGTITNNSQNATTVTVTGAQVGDSVMASNIWLADNIFAIMQAWVSALNTVTVQITNHSGGSITLTNRTIKVWVIG